MKNTMNYLIAVTFFIVGMMSTISQADTVWTGTTDTEFGTVTNWDNGSPGNLDGVAIINNGNTVNNTIDFSSSTNPYSLNVTGGSTLNSSADFTSTQLAIGSDSTVNLTSGAYTLPQTSTNNNGAGLNIQSGGTLDISGGTHAFNERSTLNGTFRVTGSAATISMNQIGTANGLFDFVFDAGGVSTITGDLGFSWFSIANANVTVDGSAFSGSGSFTLFDGHAAGNNMSASDITVTGLGTEGVDWTLDISNPANGSGLRDTVVLNIVAVPEPNSVALFGLAMVGLGFRRRR